MLTEIKNSWCVYGSVEPKGIGIIVEEGRNCLIVKCSENGPYVPWNPDCITKFSTLKQAMQAIKYYEEINLKSSPAESDSSNQKFREMIKRNFPSYFEGEHL